MRHTSRALLVVLCVAMPLSAQTSSKPSADAAFTAAYAKFSEAYQQADAGAVAALYTDDALYLAPGGNIERGNAFVRGAFQRYLGRFRSGAGPHIAFRIIERRISGGLAHDVGYFTINERAPVTDNDEPTGKFAVTWQRQRDGEWKILSDTYSDVPRAPDPARAAVEAQIRKTVQAYFDGVTNHDVARLDAAFHPVAYLATTARAGGIYHVAYQEWKKFTSEPAGSPEGKNTRIANIQQVGDAAVVTTVLDWPTIRYVDYLSLVKQGEEWRIVSKIWDAERK